MNIKTCKYNKKQFCSLGLICWHVEGRKQGVAPVPGDLKAYIPESWHYGAQERAVQEAVRTRSRHSLPQSPSKDRRALGPGGLGLQKGLRVGQTARGEDPARGQTQDRCATRQPTVSSSSSTSQPCDHSPDGNPY